MIHLPEPLVRNEVIGIDIPYSEFKQLESKVRWW